VTLVPGAGSSGLFAGINLPSAAVVQRGDKCEFPAHGIWADEKLSNQRTTAFIGTRSSFAGVFSV
jgi:hypothetical protein